MSATDPCQVTGCPYLVGPSGARGWCSVHLRRVYKHGDPQTDRPIQRKTTGGLHGRAARYGAGCRCTSCTDAYSRHLADLRARRFDRRVLVDGRLVAPLPAEKHGFPAAYANHGCRCGPCTAANSAYGRKYRAA